MKSLAFGHLSCLHLSRATALRSISRLQAAGAADTVASAVTNHQRITSTGNAYVKHCVKLRTSSKYRSEAGAILLVGSELLQEAAGAAAGARLHVRTLILGEGAPTGDHLAGPWLVAQRTVVTSEPVMRKLTGLESAAGVDAAAEINIPEPADFLQDWPQSDAPADSAPETEGSLEGSGGQVPANAAAHRTTSGGSATHAHEERNDRPAHEDHARGRGSHGAGKGRQGDMQLLQAPTSGRCFGQGSDPQYSPQRRESSPTAPDSSSAHAETPERAQHSRRRPLRRLLALDGVQDPGNLGTLMRSALAFGWDGVFLLQGCCSPFNDKAVKSSRGAVLRMAIASGSLDDLLKVAQHHRLCLIAADPEPPTQDQPAASLAAVNSQGLPDMDARLPKAMSPCGPSGVCLVLGSEGQGLSKAASDACTPVAIPMAGSMESLNVGIAGGILMWALSEGGASKLLSRLDSLNLLPRH